MQRAPILHTDLSQKVYEKLKANILSGELRPGEKLTQHKIAGDLAVSRMPLQRAYQMLEADFLVEQKPRRGFYVREYETSEILDAFEIREVLEGLAVRKLAAHPQHSEIAKRLATAFLPFTNHSTINDEEYRKNDRWFHLQIVEMTDNVILQRMNNIGHFLLHSFKPGLIRSPEETLPEHIEIIQCIAEGNSAQAEKAMMTHIQQSINILKKHTAQIIG